MQLLENYDFESITKFISEFNEHVLIKTKGNIRLLTIAIGNDTHSFGILSTDRENLEQHLVIALDIVAEEKKTN